MQTKVQQSGEGYVVMLTAQAMKDLQLVDGSDVEVRKVSAPEMEIVPLSDEEARDLFEKIEPRHRNTFAELAK